MSERPPYLLEVAAVVRETADAHTLALRVPEHWRERFAYRPGQFLTLRVPGDGARCYSLCSNPFTGGDELRVTVKRVAGGLGSNWICDHVRAGDEIQVLPPAGTFTPSSLDEDLLLVGGGSGITPLMSITEAVLTQGRGTVVLFYANRDEGSVIFAERLRGLAARHPERLVVLHWLESLHGLPDRARLSALLRPYAEREALLCGPEPLMELAAEVLSGKVLRERFFSLSGDVWAEPAPTGPDAGSQPTAHRVEVELDGERRELVWAAETTLLDAMLQAGLDAPYSCREGACAACTCRVVEGEVELVANEVLDRQDLAEGYILACQALPRSPRVAVTYG